MSSLEVLDRGHYVVVVVGVVLKGVYLPHKAICVIPRCQKALYKKSTSKIGFY